jgi:cytochrome c biogenesis protein CcmG, thiol:disulfide interchange protein DsbE
MRRRAPRLTLVFLGVVGAGLLLSWMLRSSPTEVATVGLPAPGFTVELLDGGRFDLDEQSSGRAAVVNLWASWCIPCRTEMPAISEFAAAHPEILVVGVAVEDTLASAREFGAEISPAYQLALGDAEFEAVYPRLGLPVTYVIDAGGTVTDIHNGLIDAAMLEELTGA